jgi:hypothetical protein
MAKKIWRYTMSAQEQKLWDQEEMKGWREAMVACVEDEAREQGSKKFVVYDLNNTIVAKSEVRALPQPEPVEN